jgi:hypothetical protein
MAVGLVTVGVHLDLSIGAWGDAVVVFCAFFVGQALVLPGLVYVIS